MTTDANYLDICTKAVDRAVELGAEWCDVSAGWSRDIDVAIEKTGIKSADAGQGESIGIRVFHRGGMGYAAVSGSDPDDIAAGVEQAVALAEEASPDPGFRNLPAPDPREEVPGLFDDEVAGMTVEDVIAVATRNIEIARETEGDVLLSGHVGLTVGKGALASSTGVAVGRRGTRIDAEIEATLRRGDDVGYFYDFDYGRQLDDCELDRVAASAVDGARRFLGARRIGSGKMTLVLGPLAAYGLLASMVRAASAESVQRGRSFLVGREGAVIGSDAVTLVDDGTLPRGMRSGAHDGEGTRRRRLEVVEGGVLRSLLHNSYTAGKAETESTGHGTQSGGIEPTNILVATGERPAAEIIAEVEDGLYLEAGELSPDPASGDISASIDFGFRIENGEIAHPVESAMLGANVFDLLSRLDTVSSDARTEPGAVMPTVRIHGVQVAGSE